MTAPCALRVRGLGHRYGGAHGGAPVLDGVSFDVAAGEVVAVLGPSGAGKTTLFRCLTRLVDPEEGRVLLAGRSVHDARGGELRRARRETGLIFQGFNLVRRLTALDNVLAGRLGHVAAWRGVAHRFPAADRELALAALDRVGLAAQAHQRADRLSGGQQQRVAIARVLAQRSRVVLADEPVSSLDPASAGTVLTTLRDIARERGIAVLCSLHQVDLAPGFADRILGLRDGRLVLDVPARPLGPADRQRLYGDPHRGDPAGPR